MNVLLSFILIFPIVVGALSPQPAFADSEGVNITGTVEGCGDGVMQNGEECDGSNVNGQDCVSRGFSGGTLTCSSNCTFNTSQCTSASSGGGGGGGGPIVQTPTPIPIKPVQDPVRSAQARLIDIQRDGIIDILDFNAMMVGWGLSPNLAAVGSVLNVADMNRDGSVDIIDFNTLMVYW